MAYQISLRSIKDEDHTELVRLANNKKIWQNLRDIFPHPYGDEDGRFFMKLVRQDKKNLRSVIDIDGAFAGMIGAFLQEDVYKHTAELGYWLGEPYWGKGIITKAINLKCKQVFETTEANRIFAAVFSYNIPSIKVLEKNGFKHEGIGKDAIFKDGSFYDEHRYALLRSEYEEQSNTKS